MIEETIELTLSERDVLFLLGIERFFAFDDKDNMVFFDTIRHRPFDERLSSEVSSWGLVKLGYVTNEWKVTPLGREAVNHYLRKKLCQDSPQK